MKKFCEEDLRNDLIETVAVFAGPLCGVRLNEAQVVEIADALKNTFYGVVDEIKTIEELTRLRRTVSKLQSRLRKK